jgi:hypothetical protein
MVLSYAQGVYIFYPDVEWLFQRRAEHQYRKHNQHVFVTHLWLHYLVWWDTVSGYLTAGVFREKSQQTRIALWLLQNTCYMNLHFRVSLLLITVRIYSISRKCYQLNVLLRHHTVSCTQKATNTTKASWFSEHPSCYISRRALKKTPAFCIRSNSATLGSDSSNIYVESQENQFI